MAIFKKLQALRAFQKESLPFSKPLWICYIVLAIGRALQANRPLGTKALFAARFGPSATINRRLARLKRVGVIKQRQVPKDRRRRELVLDLSISKNFERFLRLCQRTLTR